MPVKFYLYDVFIPNFFEIDLENIDIINATK